MKGHQPTRHTLPDRIYLSLRAKARSEGRSTDELLQLYALEGFLSRLADTPEAQRLVLKGGTLLAAFDARRPTRDIDLAGRELASDALAIAQTVAAVAARPANDGLMFDAGSPPARVIRDDSPYSGVRLTLVAHLASARMTLHIDVSVGDAVWPKPERIELPRLLGGTLRLWGYPLPMVYAEKVLTMVQRGQANTRWRDFADVFRLTRRYPIDGALLQASLRTVATYRQVSIEPLSGLLAGFAGVAGTDWAAWRRRQGLPELPTSFSEVLDAVIAFSDPPLCGLVSAATWQAGTGQWVEGPARSAAPDSAPPSVRSRPHRPTPGGAGQ